MTMAMTCYDYDCRPSTGLACGSPKLLPTNLGISQLNSDLIWNDRELRSGTTESWRPVKLTRCWRPRLSQNTTMPAATRYRNKVNTQRWQPIWTNPEFQHVPNIKGRPVKSLPYVPFYSKINQNNWHPMTWGFIQNVVGEVFIQNVVGKLLRSFS